MLGIVRGVPTTIGTKRPERYEGDAELRKTWATHLETDGWDH